MKRLFLVLLLFVGLSACTTIPPLNFSVNDDVLQPVQQDEKIDAELKSITVSIAKEHERLGDTQVGYAGNQYEQSFKSTFKDGLEEAIVKSALFNDNSNKTISLVAKVLKYETPTMNMNFETESIVNYKLIDRKNAKVIFSKNIKATGGVPLGYAFAGVVRMSEARNRSMQNNITNFINELKRFKINE